MAGLQQQPVFEARERADDGVGGQRSGARDQRDTSMRARVPSVPKRAAGWGSRTITTGPSVSMKTV